MLGFSFLTKVITAVPFVFYLLTLKFETRN